MRSLTKTVLACVLSSALTIAVGLGLGAGPTHSPQCTDDTPTSVLLAQAQVDQSRAESDGRFWEAEFVRFRMAVRESTGSSDVQPKDQILTDLASHMLTRSSDAHQGARLALHRANARLAELRPSADAKPH